MRYTIDDGDDIDDRPLLIDCAPSLI